MSNWGNRRQHIPELPFEIRLMLLSKDLPKIIYLLVLIFPSSPLYQSLFYRFFLSVVTQQLTRLSPPTYL